MISEERLRDETPAERDRRRARKGVDRRGLKQVAIAAAIIYGSLALLVAADIVGVEPRLTTATVVALTDRSATRRGLGCTTQLTTGFGYARIYTRNACSYARWRIGDQAEVEARRLRWTGTVVVTTRGTIFADAYSMLPQS